MTSRERFLAACRDQATDRPPVWLMRQAGRYLPEYQRVRARHSFWDMVRTPELAAEVTLQPIRRFGMDAAILFSDILTVPASMGVSVEFAEGGPVLSPLLRSAEAVARLRRAEPEAAFAFVAGAVRELAARLRPETALIGFAGAPFTLAAYLVEGGPARSVDRVKQLAYVEPALYRELVDRVAAVVADLLLLQVRAGADAVQLFDTWSLHLGPDDYRELALPATRRVIARVRDEAPATPVILYVRNAAGLLEEAAASGCDVLSIDGSLRLAEAARRLPPGVALQGNIDPALLAASPERIRAEVRQAAAAVGRRGWIVNLGQGVRPETPVEGVAALVSAVQELAA